MRLGELCSSNPLRIPHPKIDKLACQAQGVGIFAVGEITLRDAYCEHFYLIFRFLVRLLVFLLFGSLEKVKRCKGFPRFCVRLEHKFSSPQGVNTYMPCIKAFLFYHTYGGLSSEKRKMLFLAFLLSPIVYWVRKKRVQRRFPNSQKATAPAAATLRESTP